MWSDKWVKICLVEGCNKEAKTKGLCRNHYARFWRNGTTDKLNGDKRSHPLYHLWFERKTNNLLCEAWLDLDTFMKGILPKPEGDFLLLRKDGSKPFAPDNFKWQEHLKKKEGESNKDWWARKRASRISANPSMERDRNIKRKYDLTREQYNEKLKSQNFVCAICKEPETAPSRTGGTKGLAVDHCHKAEKLGILKIRDLLCWRCNVVLGKSDDSIELFQEFIKYLIKHQELN